MSMLGLSISPLSARATASRMGLSMRASCISDVRRRRRLRADHFDDSLRQLVRDGDGQVVVGDLPLAAGLAHHAAAAAFAVRRAVELLVEPGYVAARRDDDV